MTKIDWTTLDIGELQAEAEGYRDDHDDGSTAFFDPDQGLWKLELIDPMAVAAFDSKGSAAAWIKKEIEFFNSIADSRGRLYQEMIDNGVNDPVIVGVSSDCAKLWDGFHRTAIAMTRGEGLLAIVGYADSLVKSLSMAPQPKINSKPNRCIPTSEGMTP